MMRSALLAGLVALPLVAPAGAADLPAPAPAAEPAPIAIKPPSDWKFQVTLYGWATAMDGTIGVRGLKPAKVNMSAGDVLSDLNGALMGSFLAQNANWTVLLDLIFADVSDKVHLGPRGGVTAKMALQQIIGSGVVGYRVPLDLPDTMRLTGTVGFRYQHLDGDLKLNSSGGRFNFGDGGTQDWIDPTVGFIYQVNFTDKVFMNVIGDIGGFGVSSNLTAQGFAALGYKWTEAFSTSLGYRAIYTDYVSGGFEYDVTQHGVFLGAAYRF
ncbi:hypothetical protein ACRC7T_12750 [Segnochrobactraceae bacterium EtOH-i3]